MTTPIISSGRGFSFPDHFLLTFGLLQTPSSSPAPRGLRLQNTLFNETLWCSSLDNRSKMWSQTFHWSQWAWIWWHCIDSTTTSILLPIVILGPEREILLLASGEKLILPWLHNGKRMIEGRQKTHCTQSEENYLTIVPTIKKKNTLF